VKRRLRRHDHGDRGTTLIELLSAITIGLLILGILYLLLTGAARSRAAVDARVTGVEQGRQALAWITDRLRQARYDAVAACPDGLVLTGSGDGFAQRLVFRAVVDDAALPRRRLYVFYVEGGTLWQETRVEQEGDDCQAEMVRPDPDPARTALTGPIVKTFALRYFDQDGRPAAAPSAVRSVGITLRLDSSPAGRPGEAQTFSSSVTIRGP